MEATKYANDVVAALGLARVSGGDEAQVIAEALELYYQAKLQEKNEFDKYTVSAILNYVKSKVTINKQLQLEDKGVDPSHSQFLAGVETAYDDVVHELLVGIFKPKPTVVKFSVKSWRNTDKFPCPKCGRPLSTPNYLCEPCNIKLAIVANLG